MKRLRMYIGVMDKVSDVLFYLFLFSMTGVILGYASHLYSTVICFIGLIIFAFIFSVVNTGRLAIGKWGINFGSYMKARYSRWEPRKLKRKTVSGKFLRTVINFV